MARSRRSSQKQFPPHKRGALRGVVAIRREADPSNYLVVDEARKALRAEIRGVGRVFDLKDILTTVVGTSRFTDDAFLHAPKTKEIKRHVQSSKHPIPVVLGELCIYGSGKSPKFAHKLISEDLAAEIHAYEDLYEKLGFPLQTDPNFKSDPNFVPTPEKPIEDQFNMHSTHAQMFNEQGLAFFGDEATLSSFNTASRVIGETILFRPMDLPTISRR